MSAKPKFAHVVYQTAQPQEMRDWYCTELSDRTWAQQTELPPAIAVLLGAG